MATEFADWMNDLKVGDFIDAQEFEYFDSETKKFEYFGDWWDIYVVKEIKRNEYLCISDPSCILIPDFAQKHYIKAGPDGSPTVKVDKLNTYTAFHSYLENPELTICRSNNFESCHNCGKYCCADCALVVLNANIYSEKYECAQCNEQKRVDALYTILMDVFNALQLFDEHIISDIVQFSIGFIVKCKTQSCDNEICFKNEISMFNGLDADNQKITVIEREKLSVRTQGAMVNALFKDNQESDGDSEEEVKEEDIMNGDAIWNKCGGVICSSCTHRQSIEKLKVSPSFMFISYDEEDMQGLFLRESSAATSSALDEVRLFDSSSESAGAVKMANPSELDTELIDVDIDRSPITKDDDKTDRIVVENTK